MTEKEAKLNSDINHNKSMLIYYAQKEDWDKVSQLAEELKILREQRIAMFESKLSQ